MEQHGERAGGRASGESREEKGGPPARRGQNTLVPPNEGRIWNIRRAVNDDT